MSSRYTADGKRRSSQTHARRGHTCDLCGQVGFGNGFFSSHGRAHVRRGEAVELVKWYPTDPPMSTRLFLAPDDPRVLRFETEGFVCAQTARGRSTPTRPSPGAGTTA